MSFTEIRPFLESTLATPIPPESDLSSEILVDMTDVRHSYQRRARQRLLAHNAVYATFRGTEEVQSVKPALGELVLRSGFGNYGPMTIAEANGWIDKMSELPNPQVTMFLDGDHQPMAAQTTYDPPLDLLDPRIQRELNDHGPYDFITYCNSVMVDPNHQHHGLAVVLRMLLCHRVKDALRAEGGQRGCIVSQIVEQKGSEIPARITGARPVGNVFSSTNEEIPRFQRLTTNYRLWLCDIELEK